MRWPISFLFLLSLSLGGFSLFIAPTLVYAQPNQEPKVEKKIAKKKKKKRRRRNRRRKNYNRLPTHIINGGVRDLRRQDTPANRARQEAYLEIELELEEGLEDMNKAKEIEVEKREFHRFILDYELDFYYSNAFLIFNLTDKPVPEAGEKSELSVYRDLLALSFVPRFILLEASVNPMPLAGVGLREGAPDLYNRANIGQDFNAVQSVTAGFEEPYAISLFAGNMMQFSRIGREVEEGNLGYTGFLISYGSHHILNNQLIEDHWFEIEGKVKGDRNFPDHILSWSFRIGGKIHLNNEITDVLYFGIRRSLADFTDKGFSLFRNSGIEYRMDFDPIQAAAIRHYFTVDKKWPFVIGEKLEKGKLVPRRFAFVLALGFIWESNRKYSGSLRSRRGEVPNWQFVIRPNIEF